MSDTPHLRQLITQLRAEIAADSWGTAKVLLDEIGTACGWQPGHGSDVPRSVSAVFEVLANPETEGARRELAWQTLQRRVDTLNRDGVLGSLRLLPRPDYRRTGRTFRAILRALEAASQGERVAFSAYSADYARDLFRIAAGIAQGYSLEVHPLRISFASGGWVHFVGRQQRGPTNVTKHVADHYTGR